MANRFWVAGSGNWSDTNHWSTTSGGATGASAPTSIDSAIFNTLSSATSYTVGLDTGLQCLDITASAPATGTLTLDNSPGFGSLQVYGNMSFATGVNFANGVQINGYATSGTKTITSGGVDYTNISAFGLGQNGPGATYQLVDNINLPNTTLEITDCSFDANGKNITCLSFQVDYATQPNIITLSNTTITCGYFLTVGPPDYDPKPTTYKVDGLTVKSPGSGADLYILTYGRNFNNLWLTGSGGAIIFQTDSVWNDIKVDTPPHTLSFLAGIKTTLNTLTADGTPGNLNVLTSSGQYFLLGKNSVAQSYLNIDHAVVSPDGSWTVTNGTDSGSNTGINFSNAGGRHIDYSNFPKKRPNRG